LDCQRIVVCNILVELFPRHAEHALPPIWLEGVGEAEWLPAVAREQGEVGNGAGRWPVVAARR
jgi:hypothetical protein